MDDEMILDLFYERSEQAVDALKEKYGGVLRSVIVGILPDKRDAEECISDVYFAVWNTVPPQRPKALLPFLCRIGRNAALDKVRSNSAAKRNGRLLAIDELAEAIPGGDSPESETDARELARLINLFLSRCGERDRILFLRRYWYGQSVETAARSLGISANAACVRLHRLREKLRKTLKKEGYSL